MEHKIEVKFKSQKVDDKIFIQVRVNSYEFLEQVARDYKGEKMDISEVNMSVIANCEPEVEVEKYDWSYDNEPGESAITNHLKKTGIQSADQSDNNWKQLFVTLRSKVTFAFSELYFVLYGINILNELNERKKIKRKNKQKEKTNKEMTGEQYENEVDLDDFMEMPVKNQMYLNSLKRNGDKLGEDISKWTANQFGKYMRKKFKNTYGSESFEFSSFHGKSHVKMAKGREWTIIKQRLIQVFHGNGYDNQDLVNYINWAFDEKSKELNFPLNLSFICNKSLITEWIVDVNRSKNGKSGKVKEIDFDF